MGTEAYTLAENAATGIAVMTGGVGYYSVEEVVEYHADGTVTLYGWRAGMGEPRLFKTDRLHTTVRFLEG